MPKPSNEKEIQPIYPEAEEKLHQETPRRRVEELENELAKNEASQFDELDPREAQAPVQALPAKPKHYQLHAAVIQPAKIKEPETAAKPAQNQVDTDSETIFDNEIAELNPDIEEALLPQPQQTAEALPDESEYEATDAEEDILYADEAAESAFLTDILPEIPKSEAADIAVEDYLKQMDVEIAQHLEPLSLEVQETAVSILNEMTSLVREIREIQKDGSDDLSEMERVVKELCEDLFETIGLAYDEQTIEWFVHNIVYVYMLAGQELASLADFVEEGTHEQRKPDYHLLSKLLRHIKTSPPRLHLLGRLALSFRLPAPMQADFS